MKMLVQRVKYAKVSVEGKTTGEIEQGFLVLLGIAPEDTQEIMEKMVDKLLRLRIFMRTTRSICPFLMWAAVCCWCRSLRFMRTAARAIAPALSMLHRRRRRRHCTNPVRRTAGSVFRWWSPASSAQICRWSCAMTVRLPSCWIRMRS